ncbi:hypothetical protein ACHAQA_002340 [Verticillium albo-atrum]
MKLSSSITIAGTTFALGRLVTAADERHRFEWDEDVKPPYLIFHPDTIKDCSFWYDNMEGESCKEVRDVLGIKPQDFARWNPSVTVDCGNWEDEKSYCIEVRSEWPATVTFPWETSTTTTTGGTSTTQTSATPPYGTPTWEPLGCYVNNNDPEVPVMSKRITPDGGDAALTVSKCQGLCFADDWDVFLVGVEGGNTCWCSTYLVSEKVEDDDCNIPCAGREGEMCGGSNLVFAYQANFDDALPETTQVGSAGTSVTPEVQSTISTGDGQPTETTNAEDQSSDSTDSDNGVVHRDGFLLPGCIISVLTALMQLM